MKPPVLTQLVRDVLQEVPSVDVVHIYPETVPSDIGVPTRWDVSYCPVEIPHPHSPDYDNLATRDFRIPNPWVMLTFAFEVAVSPVIFEREFHELKLVTVLLALFPNLVGPELPGGRQSRLRKHHGQMDSCSSIG